MGSRRVVAGGKARALDGGLIQGFRGSAHAARGGAEEGGASGHGGNAERGGAKLGGECDKGDAERMNVCVGEEVAAAVVGREKDADQTEM